jgi:EAL domain-containing protein (putative c-di-GMP-specific phosphodiesterase class I)
MDDFGMNFASLAYLRRYPIDTLKVVQPFVQRIQKQGDQGEIVRTIISLARELNLEVIAGGVETAEQLAFLKESGCQYAQGFFISPPLDPQKAWILLATESLEPSRI